MTKTSRRLTPENSTLVVIDVQDKLLAKLPRAAEVVKNAGFLIDAAVLLAVPVRATEQYPKGLGPTTAEIARRLPAPAASKTAFSCCAAGTFLEELEMLQRPNVVVVGAETHVCVQQTALDLIAAGLHVAVPADAVCAWGDLDHATALRRLESAGATVTSAEAVAFEWVKDSTHPTFKALSQLVVARRG
ncbi:MAG: isochorismatase family protein [Gemmataceae bacterium]